MNREFDTNEFIVFHISGIQTICIVLSKNTFEGTYKKKTEKYQSQWRDKGKDNEEYSTPNSILLIVL